MKKYWFDNDPRRAAALATELEGWAGTPYRHHCGVKGLGADCIHLVCHVLVNVGAIPGSVLRHVPDYPRDWHLHRQNTLLQDMIEKYLLVERVSIDMASAGFVEGVLIDGDIVVYRFGRSNSHAAVYCRGAIFQAIEGVGVASASLSDRQWHSRIRRVYRLLQGAAR